LNLSDQDLDSIRSCLLRYWKRLVATGFSRHCRRWRLAAHELGMESVLTSIYVGATALSFMAETTWWDWPRGSATFFWNWPAEYQTSGPTKIPGYRPNSGIRFSRSAGGGTLLPLEAPFGLS
jgi:hypothetical protein